MAVAAVWSKRNMKQSYLILFLLVVLALAGCASHPKIDPNVNWNSRIGSYTFDQARAELGKPDVVIQSNEGTSADWVLKRSPQMSFGFGVGHAAIGPHIGTGVGVGTTVYPPPHGEYLHLTFSPDGKLTSWSRVQH